MTLSPARKRKEQRDALIRELWSELTLEEIGDRVAMSGAGVWRDARKICLPPKPRVRRGGGPVPAAEAPAPRPGVACDFWTPERDARLVATRGSYAALAAQADAWGVPIRRVIARYHRVRP